MFRRTGLLLVTALIAAAGARAAPPHLSSAEYDAQIARLAAGDGAVDYPALHASAGGKPGSGYAQFDRKEAAAAIAAKDFARARRISEDYLKGDPLDLNAHLYARLGASGMNDAAGSAFHQKVLDGLIAAILSSGDGRTAASAYQVIGVDEEYVVLAVRHLAPKSQSLVNEKEGAFDVLTATDEAGAEVQLWFAIGDFFGKGLM